ncbi:hypothetical protein MUP79_02215 [Candidatus Bathyarchaeota archaeon]|nr:hypothetical protein [Candidatus Bathyarchaeota archaeon]
MPGSEAGFKAAITGIVSSFIITTIINSFAPNFGEYGALIVGLFNIVSILLSLEGFMDMNCWSLLYTSGWLLGTRILQARAIRWKSYSFRPSQPLVARRMSPTDTNDSCLSDLSLACVIGVPLLSMPDSHPVLIVG